MYLNSNTNCITNLGKKKKKKTPQNHTHRNVSSFLSKGSPAIIPLYPWQLAFVNAHVSVKMYSLYTEKMIKYWSIKCMADPENKFLFTQKINTK